MSSTMGWADAFERAGGDITRSCRPPCRSRRPPARACSARRDLDAAATRKTLAAGLEGGDGSAGHIVGACDLRERCATSTRWPTPASCIAPTSNSISSTRQLFDLRRFPRDARVAQAQGAEEGAARGAVGGHIHRLADRQRSDRESLGRLLRLLHGHGRRANGVGPTSTASSFR